MKLGAQLDAKVVAARSALADALAKVRAEESAARGFFGRIAGWLHRVDAALRSF